MDSKHLFQACIGTNIYNKFLHSQITKALQASKAESKSRQTYPIQIDKI